MAFLQWGQKEEGFTIDLFSGSLTMHTFKKLPTDNPTTNTIAKSSINHLC
jgi:hypothetical protein